MNNMTMQQDTDTRPELCVPPELAPFYDFDAARKNSRITLPQEDVFFPQSVRHHVRSQIARERFEGIIPGSVPSPFRSPLAQTGVEPDPRHVELYKRSRALDDEHGEAFRADVDRIVDEVVGDQWRALDFLVHLKALDAAEETRVRVAREEDSRRRFVEEQTCPVCNQCDPTLNGKIEVRQLQPWKVAHGAAGKITFRSCAVCCEIARADYLARRSADRTFEGGPTRIESIHAALGRV
jgi:hypothetical protein